MNSTATGSYVNFLKRQITIMPFEPRPTRMRPVSNGPICRLGEDGNLREWLAREYQGNKPHGGLWTSTETPEDEYCCDWARGIATNAAIRIGVPPEARNHPAWRLVPAPGIVVRVISSWAEAESFTRDYELAPPIPLPRGMRAGPLGAMMTGQQTDWERALQHVDAIHLTEDGADEIAWEQLNRGSDNAFATWNCESVLWARWRFEGKALNIAGCKT